MDVDIIDHTAEGGNTGACANNLREFEPVNETLATEFFISKSSAKHKKFGLIDLWNCRNKRRRHGVRIR